MVVSSPTLHCQQKVDCGREVGLDACAHTIYTHFASAMQCFLIWLDVSLQVTRLIALCIEIDHSCVLISN